MCHVHFTVDYLFGVSCTEYSIIHSLNRHWRCCLQLRVFANWVPEFTVAYVKCIREPYLLRHYHWLVSRLEGER